MKTIAIVRPLRHINISKTQNKLNQPYSFFTIFRFIFKNLDFIGIGSYNSNDENNTNYIHAEQKFTVNSL